MENKTCSKCNAPKPSDQFPEGHRRCKACKKIYQKQWQVSHADEVARKAKIRYVKNKLPRRNRLLKKTYGITLDTFNKLLAFQNGGCAICKRANAGGKGSWHVDHDRSCCPKKTSCGKCVRGLLCHGCNIGIGNLGDNAAVLFNAIFYLGRPPFSEIARLQEPELFGDQR